MDVAAPLADNETSSFVVELDRFQGPLDLLLHLIREQDIDIFDIPIAQITSQFLQAIHVAQREMGLDVAGEFLEMAATLVRIKAQMLLPRRVDETGELEDPRAELVRRLLEYEHFREVALRLEAWEMERVRRFPRGYVPPRPKPQVVYGPLETTWEEIQAAAYAVGERYRPPTDHTVAHRAVPLEEKVALIVHTLARVARVEFSRLVVPFADKLHGVITFVAGLELAKRHQVELRQSEPFATLWLYRRKEEVTDETDTDR
ncbi:MAG TPA: segregation/condensation protein A [Longimicrobiales bacterium]|nr:segregation/condensation protein A [Longimicrobiales bacterium]